MNHSAIIASMIVTILLSICSCAVMIAGSHLPRRMSRLWVTMLFAFSLFGSFYWGARSLGAHSPAIVDATIRVCNAVFTTMAMWEASALLRAWARASKIGGLDIEQALSMGEEQALALMALEHIEQPAWVRNTDGQVIACNKLGKEKLEITGDSAARDADATDPDTRAIARLQSGAQLYVSEAYSYSGGELSSNAR